jgi:hypothetical protein
MISIEPDKHETASPSWELINRGQSLSLVPTNTSSCAWRVSDGLKPVNGVK